ncbi:general stress protein 69 [Oxobacter pfennigii]|uniref:General stress protein 69 n=1 Tax=Oxobacter pfennigii TaxID=36849 RepID=A0A0P8WDM8_9CLOT|nr:aldo/keto reductase [Oxobacter pfennigii]KPU46074.1 general stress protein 69 [Oxobacter pfennigii]
MQYRKFGKLDWEASALGFGCMRLPTLDGRNESVDEEEAIKMIRHAIDNGVNYVDTAYFYHGAGWVHGKSEVVLGKALKDGYREKVKVATKSPVRIIKEEGDFDRFLDEQLKALDIDYIDFYLLHGLSKHSFKTVKDLKLIEKAEAAISDGRIKHLGFSFHDDYDTFEEIINYYDGWTFCQIQYNYMDVDNQAGMKGLKLAASKGIAVVLMEPLLGGKLANPPKTVKDLFASHSKQKTPADWALQWLWNQPEVTVILSGMTTMGQVIENLKSADSSGANSLSSEDLKLIDKVREEYSQRTLIPCTGCSYCVPCPNDVEIPRNFKTYNEGYMYDDLSGARGTYVRFLGEENRAGACIQCGVCEEKCPQKIEISQWMPKVHEVLGLGKEY